MKKLLFSLVAPALVLSSSHAIAQAEVEIEWTNPDEYRDIRPANSSRKAFRQNLFSQIEKHMQKLAKGLPEGQKLTMNVTDVDLAGQVWPGHFVGIDTSSDVRLIKRIDIPRMTFTYQLLDADGKTLQEGEVKLKDMAFQERMSRTYSQDSLRYEKNMLRKWFKDTFPPMLASNN